MKTLKRWSEVLFLAVFLLLGFSLLASAEPSPVAAKGEATLAWLKGNVLVLQLIVGFLWKYVPAMKGISNDLIPWVNVVAFVVATAAGVGVAQAAPGEVAHKASFLSSVWWGFVHSGIAKVLYDGWLRPGLDRTVGKATGTV